MPCTAAVLAGYAAYVAYKKNQEQKQLENGDDADVEPVDTSGKTMIRLLPMEQKLSVLEYPITTVSFMNGNYSDVVESLKARVTAILRKNPWLGGTLVRDKENQLCLCFDENAEAEAEKHFVAFDPYVIPLIHDKTHYKDYGKLFVSTGAMVDETNRLVNRNVPFWKVAIVPDADHPEDRFALVVSMSHAAGDAATYYQLFNMLDQNATVLPLDPFRISYQQQLQEMVGDKEHKYLGQAVGKPIVDLTGASDEPCVYKTFYVNEDWMQQRKKQRRRVSVYDADTTLAKSAQLLSDPLLTEEESIEKWHRLDEPVEESEPGTAETGARSDAPPAMKESKTLAAIVSANSILTSWFFNLSAPNVGLMVVNLRNRIQNCPLADNSAGNYVFPIAYMASDYETPQLIQDSIPSLRRCGPTHLAPLPNFGWNMTSALSASWAGHYRQEISLHESTSTELHMPVFSVDFIDVFPNRVSVMHMFTAKPRRDSSGENRAGALVICRQSVWEKIRASGIVVDMIAET